MPLAEPIYLSTQSRDDDSEPDVPDIVDIDPPEQGDDDGDDGDGDRSRWVTVATFFEPTNAHLARIRLENEQIACMLLGETVVAAVGAYAAGASVQLRVPEPDAARAREILNERPPRMAVPADQIDDPPEVRHDALQCPECRSTDLERPLLLARNLWALVVMLLLTGTVLIVLTPLLLTIYFVWLRPYRCAVCGNVWTDTTKSRRRGFEVRQIQD
jgi:hypothetical protein